MFFGDGWYNVDDDVGCFTFIADSRSDDNRPEVGSSVRRSVVTCSFGLAIPCTFISSTAVVLNPESERADVTIGLAFPDSWPPLEREILILDVDGESVFLIPAKFNFDGEGDFGGGDLLMKNSAKQILHWT